MDQVELSEPIQTLPSQNLSRSQLILASIIVFFIACVGSYYVGSRNALNPKSPPENLPTIAVLTVAPTLSPMLSPSVLKSLDNQYGFSLQYDSSLKVNGQGMAVDVDPTAESALTFVADDGVYDNTQEDPYMEIVVFKAEDSHYNIKTLEEFVQANFKENTENKNIVTKVLEPIHETIFKGGKAFTYLFECRGFSGVYTSQLAAPGKCRMIFTENNGKYFFIGYYEIPIFEQAISTFKYIRRREI